MCTLCLLSRLKVILDNLQSMQRTLEEIEQCKGQLDLPAGALESLKVFPRAELVLQSLQELQERTRQRGAPQVVLQEVCSPLHRPVSCSPFHVP